MAMAEKLLKVRDELFDGSLGGVLKLFGWCCVFPLVTLWFVRAEPPQHPPETVESRRNMMDSP